MSGEEEGNMFLCTPLGACPTCSFLSAEWDVLEVLFLPVRYKDRRKNCLMMLPLSVFFFQKTLKIQDMGLMSMAGMIPSAQSGAPVRHQPCNLPLTRGQ